VDIFTCKKWPELGWGPWGHIEWPWCHIGWPGGHRCVGSRGQL